MLWPSLRLPCHMTWTLQYWLAVARKATALTGIEWPSNVRGKTAYQHPGAVQSCHPDADATSLPSGEKGTALTEYEWCLKVAVASTRTRVLQPDCVVVRCRCFSASYLHSREGGRPAYMSFEVYPNM